MTRTEIRSGIWRHATRLPGKRQNLSGPKFLINFLNFVTPCDCRLQSAFFLMKVGTSRSSVRRGGCGATVSSPGREG